MQRMTDVYKRQLGYGEDEPDEDASDTPRASGSSFDEIDDACKTAMNPDATQMCIRDRTTGASTL